MECVSFVVSKFLNLVIEIQINFLGKFILNIKDDTPTLVAKSLITGNKLCKERMTPMSSELVTKVKEIYESCVSRNRDPPLMLALDMELMDLAWGFIQCAIQTQTNLQTGETGDDGCVRDFFWLSNRKNQTAFDIAIEKYDIELARLLWNNSNFGLTTFQWEWRRKAMLQLLNDHIYDILIFNLLEGEKRKQDSTTSMEISSQRRDQPPDILKNLGNCLLGSNASKNTLVHLASKIGDVASIKYILEKDPSQIHSRNSDMETATYIAAREGHADVLRFMINILKKENQDVESNATRSRDKHNALHIAIQNHHVEVVFLLIEEIPQLANRVNEVRVSPLYVAAERGYYGIVARMLKKCKDINYDGPDGKTALHAAAISDSPWCITDLLNKNIDLLRAVDNRGWTALHHAVYHNSWISTKYLLFRDYSIGYYEIIQEADGISINTSSAIHIAASQGHSETMKVLIDECPGCTEFIDNKGRNILHVAVENKKNKAIEFIFRDESLTNLINQKDNNGNTPIHLLVISDFEKMEMLMDYRVNINILNNEKLTPFDIISQDHRDRLIKAMYSKKTMVSLKPNKNGVNEKEKTHIKVKKTERHFGIVDNLVVVAALTATASFAASFTVPGGFDSSSSNINSKQAGTPFLLQKPAFIAFIVSNAIAFSSSCSVLLGYVALLFYRKRLEEPSPAELKYIDGKVEDMYYLTTWALLAMTIAYFTGAYVVLTPLLGLAISVCVVSLLLIAFNIHKDKFQRS